MIYRTADGNFLIKRRPKRRRGEVAYFFVRVRPENAENLAVTAVQYAAARPMAGVPFSIRPHLTAQGDRAAACDVSLVVDGRQVAQRRVDKLQNGRWAVPRFDHTFDSGGWHSGYVEVNDPALPQDNRRYFAFEVLDGVRVLAVNGAPSQVHRLDELFFLKLALTASPENKSPIQVDTVSPSALTGADFGKYPLVILANVESLPAPAVEVLEGYVDRGGSLLVFLGDQVNPDFYNPNLAAPTRLHGGLMPGRLLGREGDPQAAGDVATVGEIDDAHPALAAFHDPQFASLAGVGFKALWGIDPSAGATILMRTSTGGPLLLERPVRQGARGGVREHRGSRLDEFPGASGVPAVGPPPRRLPRAGAARPRGLLRHGRRRARSRRRVGGTPAALRQEARRRPRPRRRHRRPRPPPRLH